MREKINSIIKNLRELKVFTPREDAVLRLIETASKASPITQLQIARSQAWLGVHPKHEANAVKLKAALDSKTTTSGLAIISEESSVRQVRQIVRDLRLKYGILILASSKGYFIAETEQDAADYLETKYKEMTATYRSHIINYRILSKKLNLNFPLFGDQLKGAIGAIDAGDDDEFRLLEYLENRRFKVGLPPKYTTPLNMRIGGESLSFLDGKRVRAGFTGEIYIITNALYLGCFVKTEGGSESAFEWDETKDWEILA